MCKGGVKVKVRKILAFVVIVAMFILVSCIDTVEDTNTNDISSAKIQAQINLESRGR